jgi:hypothetical protein
VAGAPPEVRQAVPLLLREIAIVAELNHPNIALFGGRDRRLPIRHASHPRRTVSVALSARGALIDDAVRIA